MGDDRLRPLTSHGLSTGRSHPSASARLVTAHLYVRSVLLYRAVGHPLLEGSIRCRYVPTCSEYSIETVEQYGIRRGLWMTIHRIDSCTRKVPLGTRDPLPRPTQSTQ